MIDVLMATYQPNEVWLSAQISSIRGQCGVDVHLVCHEDRMGKGACANFAALLKNSQAHYVAFADQDDVWVPDKLLQCLTEMHRLEERWGKDVPLLVFSDARVVDADLNELASSLFRRIHIDPRRNLPRQLILQNTAYGNTMLFNAALRDLVNPIPEDAVMHDHWTMLVASSFGHIGYVPEPLVLYRQHGNNIFGGVKVGASYYMGLVRKGRAALRARLYANLRQVETFVLRFGERTPRELKSLVGLQERCWPIRVGTLIRNGIFKCGFLRNLGVWLAI